MLIVLNKYGLFGVRKTKKWSWDGSYRDIKTHRWGAWRASEPRHDMLHLSDKMRISMAGEVVKERWGRGRGLMVMELLLGSRVISV